jgi:hypothetical protein
MAYLIKQRQNGGRYTTIYATVATWADLPKGGRGAVQQRLYVGRFNADKDTVRVSKGIVGPCALDIDFGDLRSRVSEAGNLEAVREWLRSQCDSPPPSAASGLRLCLRTDELGTALIGQCHVLRTLAAETGLERCLLETFGEAEGLALLHLAMHQLVAARPLYLAASWLDDLWLPKAIADFDFSSAGLSRFMNRVGRSETTRQAFYESWLRRRGGPRALIYDTTSISTYASTLEAAAFGHNRDGEHLPQENLALVCDRTDGMPLFCRLVPGSVPDVITLDATARMLRALGLAEAEFALDRGFYSNSNLRELLLHGHHFTIGALLSCRQSKELLARYRTTLKSPRHSICHEGRCVRHVRDSWEVDMGRDANGAKRGKRVVEAHVFFDPRRHADRISELDERVFALEDRASRESFANQGQAKAWLVENARRLAPCLGIGVGPDGAVTLHRKPRAIASRTATAGYHIVLCDTPGREPVEVLSDYRSRDRVEKLFHMLKNGDGQRRFRTGNQSVAEGRILLAFLALALRAELENRLRDSGLLKTVSLAEFLAEMGRIRAIRLPGGDRLLREISKRQRKWLESVRVPPIQL